MKTTHAPDGCCDDFVWAGSVPVRCACSLEIFDPGFECSPLLIVGHMVMGGGGSGNLKLLHQSRNYLWVGEIFKKLAGAEIAVPGIVRCKFYWRRGGYGGGFIRRRRGYKLCVAELRTQPRQ